MTSGALVDIAVTIEVLPARLGDCLLVECHRPSASPWRMLVDGGPLDTWPLLKARLAQLPARDRRLDLVVVTHIDSDHIGGLIPFFQHGVPGVTVDEVWFNGREQLPDHLGLSRSVSQGESVVAALAGHHPGHSPRWNASFGGAAVMTPEQGQFVECSVAEGPRLTVLSPTVKRLAILRRHWINEMAKVRRGEPTEPAGPASPMMPLADVPTLAAQRSDRDQSVPNGSSIVLLLEHRGASCLLTGDAFPNVLGAALKGLADYRGMPNIPVDAFKLPHHASKGNVTTLLVQLAPAQHYLVSTNGDYFHHPDDAALARVVLGAPTGAALYFNYTNERTERWGTPEVVERYHYAAHYPRADSAGIRIQLQARPT
jgi:Metallo-beta-lactamase superfamily